MSNWRSIQLYVYFESWKSDCQKLKYDKTHFLHYDSHNGTHLSGLILTRKALPLSSWVLILSMTIMVYVIASCAFKMMKFDLFEGDLCQNLDKRSIRTFSMNASVTSQWHVICIMWPIIVFYIFNPFLSGYCIGTVLTQKHISRLPAVRFAQSKACNTSQNVFLTHSDSFSVSQDNLVPVWQHPWHSTDPLEVPK